MEPLVNINEAAQLLGLSSWTVRKLIANHRLGSVRINRRVLLEPSEIARIVSEGRGKRNPPQKADSAAADPLDAASRTASSKGAAAFD